MSPSLLRLWRTGAEKFMYSSSEDDDCDVNYFNTYDIILNHDFTFSSL